MILITQIDPLALTTILQARTVTTGLEYKNPCLTGSITCCYVFIQLHVRRVSRQLLFLSTKNLVIQDIWIHTSLCFTYLQYLRINLSMKTLLIHLHVASSKVPFRYLIICFASTIGDCFGISINLLVRPTPIEMPGMLWHIYLNHHTPDLINIIDQFDVGFKRCYNSTY